MAKKNEQQQEPEVKKEVEKIATEEIQNPPAPPEEQNQNEGSKGDNSENAPKEDSISEQLKIANDEIKNRDQKIESLQDEIESLQEKLKTSSDPSTELDELKQSFEDYQKEHHQAIVENRQEKQKNMKAREECKTEAMKFVEKLAELLK